MKITKFLAAGPVRTALEVAFLLLRVFYPEMSFFGILWNILEYFGIFWNNLEYFGKFGNVLEYFGNFWNIPEYFGIFLNILEYSWIFWNFPDIMEYSCTFWNIPEYFGIFLNTFEYSGILYPAARTEMFFSLVSLAFRVVMFSPQIIKTYRLNLNGQRQAIPHFNPWSVLI